MNLLAFSTHARSVPVEARERFADAARQAAPDGISLHTCHRAEVYLAGGDQGEREALAAILPAGGRRLAGPEVTRHLLAVAAGDDSAVLGEEQILGQVRDALVQARARDRGVTPVLDRLFSTAIRTGRVARSWGGGRASLADPAVERIVRDGPPHGPILVVGSGQMGRRSVAAALEARASVLVASPTSAHGRALADAHAGVVSVPFDPGPQVRGLRGVIVALRGPWSVGPGTRAALAGGAAIVVDLSSPGAVDPALASQLGPRLVTIDALARNARDAAGRPDERLQRLIDANAAAFASWLSGRDARSAAGALRDGAETARSAQVEALWRRLPELQADQRHAIEEMTRALADRILREPLERLGRDRDGEYEQHARALFGL